MHGDNDRILAVADSAMPSSKCENAQLKVHKGAPHCTTHKDEINADLLAFIRG
jgi:non-heme chloroperoxidase